jgi:hypothetical protein
MKFLSKFSGLKRKKAQASIEILAIVTIIFVVFLMLHIFVITPTMEETRDRNLIFAAETACEKIANAINTMSYSGDGSYTNFTLPTLLDSKEPYIATIFRNYVRVAWEEGSRTCHTTTRQVLRVLPTIQPEQVAFAYLLKENCMYDELQNFNVTIFCNKNYENSCPAMSDPCVNKTGAERLAEHNDFMQKIYNFTLIFADEPHFSESEMDTIEAHTYYGGYSFLSEHLIDAVNSSSIFDDTITYNYRDENIGSDEISIDTSDSLLDFTTADDFTPDEYPYLNGTFDAIGLFSDSKVGVARWEYGDGKVYYFSDFDSSLSPTDGAEFREKIANSVNNTLQYLSTLVRTPFTLSENYYTVYNDDEKIYIIGWS